MEKRMEVTFPGNKRVACQWGDMIVHTDQSKRNGGDESAPQPFDLFFTSLATCAGISALEFLQERNLPQEGLRVALVATLNRAERRYDRIRIEVTPPPDLPEKFFDGLLEEASDCSVKKHILKPPVFSTVMIKPDADACN